MALSLLAMPEKATLSTAPTQHSLIVGSHQKEHSFSLSRRPIWKSSWLLAPVATVIYLIFISLPGSSLSRWIPRQQNASARSRAICVQPAALFPSNKSSELDRAYEHLASDAFRNATVDHLAGAVKVKTQTFDDLGEVGEDPRWEVFFEFSAYLEKTFPLLHKTLRVEKVNTHGLLYTWNGSDSQLKPMLLMGHQDTVPVPADTIDAWTYPPWSGAYDGKFIWGRGAHDCKDQVIAILESVELLLGAGFQPRRTILLSFGYDEEAFGYHGAGNLSAVIRDRYSSSGGLAVLVDEGARFEQAWGTLFAKPATTEKGACNVEIVIRTPGGHSSIPQDHTGIGILSELITEIEASQYPIHLDDSNPYFTQLHCGAAFSPEFPPKLRKLLAEREPKALSQHDCHGSAPSKPDYLALEAAKQGPDVRYLMQTSQAVDIISGGGKVNALPERVRAVINHRVNIGETTAIVHDRLTAIAGGVAEKYNLTLHAFDGMEEEPSSITLSSPGFHLDPAPVAPADGSVTSPFSVLAGSVRAVYGEETVVSESYHYLSTPNCFQIFASGIWSERPASPLKYNRQDVFIGTCSPN